MAIKRYKANADTTITNAYKANLQTRATASNMGQADILETFTLYAQESSSSSELERILVKFPATGTTAGYIAHDRELGTIPASGSVSFYLRLFNARQSQTTPKDFSLTVHAVTTDWDEGLGLDMVDYSDTGPASWRYANDTKIAQITTASFASATRADYGGDYISLYDTSKNRFNFWFNAGSDTAPAQAGTEVEVDISSDGTAAAIAETFKDVVHARSEFGATRSTATVTVTNATSGKVGVGTLQSPTGTTNYVALGITVTGSDYTAWTTAGGDYTDGVPGSVFTASFDGGFEDMDLDITPLVEQWINSAGNVLGSKSNYGVMVKMLTSLEDGTESYYTKKFFARGSQFFFRRPIIEARWDSSTKDDRGNFYYSSSLAPGSDNTNTLYLYNYVRGQLKNIPGIEKTGSIMVSLYSGSADNTEPTGAKLQLSAHDLAGFTTANDLAATGGWVETGIYSASLAFTGSTSLTNVFDVWSTGSFGNQDIIQYFTGAIAPKSFTSVWPGSEINPNQQFVSTVTNLKPIYSTANAGARIRLYTRKKDWSPTIYTVSSQKMPIDLVEDVYYKVYRVNDNTEAIAYGTGSDNSTRLSFDTSGSYIDVDMSMLEGGDTYAIKFVYYLNGQYIEQPEKFTFKVE
tara:strand:+ start:3400 stop:5301 length:1902 start_codon:yes stop_codon:yes gene_type:complete